MPLIGALFVVLALLGFLWWAIAHEPGPGPADVAIAYEQAWNDLDFSLLYDLSGPELRDGMRREQFVAAKRAAYAQAHAHGPVDAHVDIDAVTASGQTALVVTEVLPQTAAGGEGAVRNNVLLERTANGWVVVGYTLRS